MSNLWHDKDINVQIMKDKAETKREDVDRKYMQNSNAIVHNIQSKYSKSNKICQLTDQISVSTLPWLELLREHSVQGSTRLSIALQRTDCQDPAWTKLMNTFN